MWSTLVRRVGWIGSRNGCGYWNNVNGALAWRRRWWWSPVVVEGSCGFHRNWLTQPSFVPTCRTFSLLSEEQGSSSSSSSRRRSRQRDGSSHKRNPQNSRGGGGSKKARERRRRQRRRAFVDVIRVSVQGGAGGQGCQSFDRSGRNRRPDGGHGGDGGWVIVVAERGSGFSSLSAVSSSTAAQDGANGTSQGRHGRNGRNRIIRVPCGVVVRQILHDNQHWDASAKRVVTRSPHEDDGLPTHHDLRYGSDWEGSSEQESWDQYDSDSDDDDDDESDDDEDDDDEEEEDDDDDEDDDDEYDDDGDEDDDDDDEYDDDEDEDEDDDDEYDSNDDDEYDSDDDRHRDRTNEEGSEHDDVQTDQLDHSNVAVEVSAQSGFEEEGFSLGEGGGRSDNPSEIVHLSSALGVVSASFGRNQSPDSSVAQPNGADEAMNNVASNIEAEKRYRGLLRVVDEQNSRIRATAAVEDLSDEDEAWMARLDHGGTFDVHGNRRKKVLLADLDRPGSYVVVARGGTGGVGNVAFPKLLQQWGYAKRKRGARRAPARWRHRAAGHMDRLAKGTDGERSLVEMELKLIADVGLVGFPNAGKSSLLGAMSRAAPKVAPYPFTTLNPIIGCIEYRDGFQVMAADVPGLISGASVGRGKGYDFLRHLERTKVLLYVVDAASVDGRHPVQDLEVLVEEIGAYSGGEMLLRPALLVANKLDLIPSGSERHSLFRELLLTAETAGIALCDTEVYGISAGVSGEGLVSLSRAIRRTVKKQT